MNIPSHKQCLYIQQYLSPIVVAREQREAAVHRGQEKATARYSYDTQHGQLINVLITRLQQQLRHELYVYEHADMSDDCRGCT